MKTLTGTLVLLAAISLAGCGGGGSSGGSGESKVLVGAGSTLVAPLVAQWSTDYAKKTGVTITYGAIGYNGIRLDQASEAAAGSQRADLGFM